MKILGLIALVVGAAFLAFYVGGWIALIDAHGPTKALRLGFTLWPGNAIQIAVIVLIFVLGGGGLMLLTGKK